MGFRSAVAARLSRAALALGGPEGPDREPVMDLRREAQVEYPELGPTHAAKAFGGNEPPGMQQAAEDVSQMGPQNPFSPGEPVGPYDGYGRMPRTQDFVTGYNIATRPRTHERVSFDTLRGLIDAYDIASIVIWHKIDTLRGVKWKILAADNYNGDVSGAVNIATDVMRRPDGIHGFRAWFGKWYYDVFAYDAAPLYRLRNRGGKVIGLSPFDGTTLAPLLDYWGNPPSNPGAPPDEQPEAYVQYANGVPWNWLTRADVIYEPFRAVNSSVYGKAPIESIILNANTDLRFQLRFLQQFTDGNIPAGFASAPENWTPDDIERFQGFWDSIMYGDQAMKSQIRWIPGGSSFIWSNEKEFTDAFSLFLMRKTCACYHVVPTDLGFTETSNYSSGESQADVQHKAGELPPMEYAEEIISRFLYDDLGLPVKFEFDRGEDQDDRLVQAQADGQYIDRGVVGPSEIREMRFGLPEPEGQTVPRYIMTSRAGPVPLASLLGVAGKIDPESGAPDPGSQLPHEAFTEVAGVVPNPPLTEEPLAEQEYGPKAIPPAPPVQAPGVPLATDPNAPKVAKEAEGAPAAGITSETGIYGYDGPGSDGEDDKAALRAAQARALAEQDERAEVAKSELAAFRRFRAARRRSGQWRDFTFEAVDPVRAHRLNDGGRLAVRKDAGEIAVAGLAVLAADTGRVLMLQRALDPDDPAGGTWEFPGGHIEEGETPIQGAWREWAEESGCIPAPGALAGTWTSSNGIYQGFVWRIDSESMVPVRSDTEITNPDDPDGDQVEAVAFWDPATLPGNAAVRPELLADIDAVMAALGCQQECCGAECCSGACCGGAGGCPCGASECPPADVAKAGDESRPKVAPAVWPGWALNRKAVAYWSPLLAAALLAALSKTRAQQLAAAYLDAFPGGQQDGQGRQQAVDAAAAWLAAQGIDLAPALESLAAGLTADGWLIGAASAAAMADGGDADTGGWRPGDADAAGSRVADLGLSSPLGAALGSADQAAGQMAAGYLAGLARALLDSAAAGLSAAATGAALLGALGDAAKAATAVLGQLVEAVASAAQALYGQRGITEVDVVNGPNPCPACLALAESNPHPPGTIPLHPNCECSEVPRRT